MNLYNSEKIDPKSKVLDYLHYLRKVRGGLSDYNGRFLSQTILDFINAGMSVKMAKTPVIIPKKLRGSFKQKDITDILLNFRIFIGKKN